MDKNEIIGLLNSEEIVRSFGENKNVYIYGAGMDGELFLKEMNTKINVIGVIDSYKYDQEWHGYKVLKMDCCRNLDVAGSLIITCFDYRDEIVTNLLKMGLVIGTDFFVWDRLCSYKIDSSTARLIEWNKKTWHCDNEPNDCRALVPIHYSLHDGGAIMYSYIVDYLRERYNPSFDAYVIHWKDTVCPTISSVYESFGVIDVLTGELTSQQEEEAKEIFEETWAGIRTYTDWKNINIYGIHMGSVIIRTFLRFYVFDFDPRAQFQKDFLFECVKKIVYWYYRFEVYDYKLVLTWDGGAFDAIIANIAIAKGIPTYSMYFIAGRRMVFDDPWYGRQFIHYNEFWNQLSDVEKEYGLKWAKTELDNRLGGNGKNSIAIKDAYDAYKVKKTSERITGNEKVKIVIVPHSFEDDSYMYGEHLFDDNYFSWMCHLGNLSNRYDGYGWYMKIHPMSSARDRVIVNKVLKQYPNIKVLPERVSVSQMKEEGINWALTVQGSIGHEYPLLGIQVINAGENPHMAFDFNWNPRSIDEYDELIGNIEKMQPKENIEELYKYYCIDQLYYDYEKRFGEEFFENPLLNADDQRLALGDAVIRNGTWKYSMFLDAITLEEHERLKKKIANRFDTFDAWREDVFYKKNVLCK